MVRREELRRSDKGRSFANIWPAREKRSHFAVRVGARRGGVGDTKETCCVGQTAHHPTAPVGAARQSAKTYDATARRLIFFSKKGRSFTGCRDSGAVRRTDTINVGSGPAFLMWTGLLERTRPPAAGPQSAGAKIVWASSVTGRSPSPPPTPHLPLPQLPHCHTCPPQIIMLQPTCPT